MNKFRFVLLMMVSLWLCGCQRNEKHVVEAQKDFIITNEEGNKTSNIVDTGKSADEAFEMLPIVFEGNPSLESVKKLLSAVMDKYHLEVNYENINRCASAVLSLREASAVGVTEMDLLKHMYQQGDDRLSFPNQAGVSATILEAYK